MEEYGVKIFDVSRIHINIKFKMGSLMKQETKCPRERAQNHTHMHRFSFYIIEESLKFCGEQKKLISKLFQDYELSSCKRKRVPTKSDQFQMD